ncbi:DUF397 domain-containing protein [Plantactinospora sp. CA-294935]|uniref:DUF397 domain-containing protein n=1 Tax=Plantactinospora sp. CA-294935 TaxID=3240012 RepID=UPI003D8A2FA8
MTDGSGRPVWRKSSASLNGDCVEVASLPDGVGVRDSKNPDGGALRFTRSQWRAFLLGPGRGESVDL